MLLKVQLARFGQGQQAQVFHQALEQIGFFQRGDDVLLVGRVNAIQDALQAAAHDGQRRAQFVGDVGQHVAPFAVVALERVGHLVETVAQGAQVVRSLHADTGAQVPVRHILGGGDHFRQRHHHAPGEQQSDHDGQNRHEDGDHDDGLQEIEVSVVGAA